MPKSFIAASLPQFWCDYTVPGNDCQQISITNADGTITREYAYAYVRDLLEGSVTEYWPMIGWLLLTMLIIRILNLLALRFVSHIKR